ncbi:hypothetical protein BDQ12DRAFT_656491 [Crucibulum laeve]|uniref:F-box domain-containing protein n=1 Tax=Crucibulum laeve TaxID=68775 RepID=A0A5C3LNP5_9AGAR|nr:hypothetical protein BDQ12DRAFT_656491 [Crucibulum laeve]
MHRCLSIPEIIHLICDEISNKKKANSSLLALAYTCRTFLEPALNLVWYELENIVPLVKCLSDDVWEERGEQIKYLRLKMPIEPSDFERFNFYACRVRILGMTGAKKYGTVYAIDREILYALKLATKSRCIFPRLQRLGWDSLDDTTFSTIHLFLAPTLSTLRISFQGSPAIRLSLFPTLSEICPLITHIEFAGPPSLPYSAHDQRREVIISVSSVLFSWKGLISVCVDEITTEALVELSTSSTIHTFRIRRNIDDVSLRLYLSLRPQTSGFHFLRDLDICSTTIESCNALLPIIASEVLQSVKVSVRHRSSPSAWKKFFADLAVHLPISSLTELCVQDVVDMSHRIHPIILPAFRFDTILPVLYFRNLTVLCIQPSSGLILGNEDIFKMSLAWPRMRYISLGTAFRSSWGSSVTLNGLLHFAARCHHLEFLAIIIDTTVLPIKVDGKIMKGHSLKTLRVGDSPITNPIVVAEFIWDVFPGLEYLNFFDPEGYIARSSAAALISTSSFHRGWREVDRCLKVFRSIRSQQEIYWKSTSKP